MSAWALSSNGADARHRLEDLQQQGVVHLWLASSCRHLVVPFCRAGGPPPSGWLTVGDRSRCGRSRRRSAPRVPASPARSRLAPVLHLPGVVEHVPGDATGDVPVGPRPSCHRSGAGALAAREHLQDRRPLRGDGLGRRPRPARRSSTRSCGCRRPRPTRRAGASCRGRARRPAAPCAATGAKRPRCRRASPRTPRRWRPDAWPGPWSRACRPRPPACRAPRTRCWPSQAGAPRRSGLVAVVGNFSPARATTGS